MLSANSYVLSRFAVVGGTIVVLEIVLGSWPVVATSIWGSRAVDTWIHFLYWIKALFLFMAVMQNRWAPWRLGPRRRGQSAVAAAQPRYFEVCMGATASCELATWILISVVAHALLSAIVLLLVLVLKNEFQSNTQWVLSVVFDAVGIAESILSPMVVTRLGISEQDAELLYEDAEAFTPPTPITSHFSAQKRVRFVTAPPAPRSLQSEYGLS